MRVLQLQIIGSIYSMGIVSGLSVGGAFQHMGEQLSVVKPLASRGTATRDTRKAERYY